MATRTGFGDGASTRPPTGRVRPLLLVAAGLVAAVAVGVVMVAQSLLVFAIAYGGALGITAAAGVIFFRRSRGAGNWRP